MTVQADFRLNLVAAISGELPAVQVLPGPPGENQATEETVYVDQISSTFEWRSLGNLTTNRTEELSAVVRAIVYREAPDQMDALADADARMDEIVAAVESAVAPDPTITGALSYGLLESADRSVAPAERGWIVTAVMRVTGTNHPGT
jgi:hypothetical protein